MTTSFREATPLEELTRKIHKHCPALLELSFGCQLRSGKGVYRLISEGKNEETGELWRILIDDQDLLLPGENVVIDEILGHPITLEHVLKAMNVQAHGASQVSVDNLGGFAYCYTGDVLPGWEKQDLHWHLGKPLSEQSPETIEWLNQIIV